MNLFDEEEAIVSCDKCAEEGKASKPFQCLHCAEMYCEHHDADGLVCVGCFATKTTKRMDPSKASAHWPRVDGTAGDLEYAEPGSSWRVAALWLGIAAIFVLMLWLVLN